MLYSPNTVDRPPHPRTQPHQVDDAGGYQGELPTNFDPPNLNRYEGDLAVK